MSVGKSLYQTEEEQRCAQPPHHTEPLWDPAGKAEEVVDVIHDHGHQGDHLRPVSVIPPVLVNVRVDSIAEVFFLILPLW